MAEPGVTVEQQMIVLGREAGDRSGGLLVGVIPSAMLVPALAALLAVSAVRVWKHD